MPRGRLLDFYLFASKRTAFNHKGWLYIWVNGAGPLKGRRQVCMYFFHPLRYFIARFLHFYPALIQQDLRCPFYFVRLELWVPPTHMMGISLFRRLPTCTRALPCLLASRAPWGLCSRKLGYWSCTPRRAPWSWQMRSSFIPILPKPQPSRIWLMELCWKHPRWVASP